LWWVFFKIGSFELFAWGCLPAKSLPISASWVAKIKGVKKQHQCPAFSDFFWGVHTGVWTRGLTLARQGSTSWGTPPPPKMGFLDIISSWMTSQEILQNL
jgi:hypothetical protein